VIASICPHSGKSRHSLGGNGEVGAGADEHLFQAANEIDSAEMLAERRRANLRLARADPSTSLRAGFCVHPYTTKTPQVEDRIADDLAGTVECDVAATIAFEEFNTPLGQEFGRSHYIRSFGIAAESDDGLVLEQEKDVANFFIFP